MTDGPPQPAPLVLLEELRARVEELERERRESPPPGGGPATSGPAAGTDDRFATIFRHSNDAIFFLDPESGAIVDANPRACAFLGYSRDELLALNMADVHPHELPRMRAFARSVMRQGEGWSDEMSCLTKGGARVPAEMSASVATVDGELRMISLVRDISQRKAAQDALERQSRELEAKVERRTRALRRSEERLRTLLAVSNATVSKLDPKSLSEAVAEVLAGVVDFDRLALTLYDGDRGTLTVAGLAGDPTLRETVPLGTELGRGDTMLHDAVARRRPLYVEDLERDASGRTLTRLRHEGLASFLAVPLLLQERILGVLVFGSRRTEPFTRDHVELLTEVAEQVALAVDNMLAYQEIERLRSRLEQEKLYLEEEIRSAHGFDEFVGRSEPVQRVLHAVETVAPTDATVLLHGETGTGKELVARAIHARSRRSGAALVKVNCAALPSELIESELFGHEKGAFTGATARRAGRFELADGGTLFLDEIGELPLALQAKLLTVLQDGEFQRVGGTRTLTTDVRVVAATNRDLKAEVEAGHFRSDLFFRLNVFPVELPPLRRRRADVPLLVRHFAMKHGSRLGKTIETIPKAALDDLAALPWPGNVRELENLVERAVILSRGPELEISPLVREARALAAPESALVPLEEAQRRHILRALEHTGWKVSGPGGAAELLRIKPTTLESRMKKLGIRRRE